MLSTQTVPFKVCCGLTVQVQAILLLLLCTIESHKLIKELDTANFLLKTLVLTYK